MSYYYTYYAGYMLDGKIYPLGPYDCDGKLRPIVEKSRSFASNLHDYFYCVRDEQISDELRKDFEYEGWSGEKRVDVRYLPISNLPKGSFVKRGYFLISDVRQYERDDCDFDGFFDMLPPQVYAAKLQNELLLGKNQPKEDEEDEDFSGRSASNYMYYAYPDYNSREYEAHMIREAVENLKDYRYPDDRVFVALETEG